MVDRLEKRIKQIWHYLLISRNDTLSDIRNAEPITRKYVKGYRFLSLARKCKNNKGLDSLKTACKKVVHRNKTGEVVTITNDNKIVKPDKNPTNAVKNGSK